jgi:hypothetical protein
MTKNVNAKLWILSRHPDGSNQSVPPANLGPYWIGPPAPSGWQATVGASYAFPVADPEGDPITLSSIGASLAGTGLSINQATRSLVYDGSGSPRTISGLQFRATSTGGVTDSAVFSVTIAAAPAAAIDVTTFALTAAVGGTLVPFRAGHPFRQGDIPAGSHIGSDIPDFQASPQTFWPDGSVKHAIIAGRRNLTTNVAANIALRRTPTAPTGSALTTAQLIAAMPVGVNTITGGGHTTTLNAAFLGSPFRTVVAGPQMANWIYRQPVAGSNHLVVFVEVTLYAGGAIEIFPWVENGYLLVAGPTNDVRTWAVTLGGVSRFSQSIDIKHHTRIPLITGRVDGYWVGTDHGVIPRHNAAYLRSTKLVPNYNWTAPSDATLNALTQAYTPGDWAGIPLMNSSGGDSSAILGFTARAPDVLYCATGDARAYRGAMAMSFAGGSWDVHHRDHITNEHVRFSDHPLASYQTGTVPQGTGGNSNWGATGSRTSHQISRGFLAWMISGRWWHLDEALFWTTQIYLYQTPSARENAAGIIKTTAGANTDRGAAWGLRQLAQTLALTPTSHPMHAELTASWEATTQWYLTSVTTGTWANNLGMFPTYIQGPFGTAVYGFYPGYADFPVWMQMMLVGVLGYTWDLGLPQSAASATRHQQIRDHGYKMAVGFSGDGSAGQANYRWFGPYAAPYVASNGVGGIFTNWRQSQDVVVSANGVTPPDANNLYRHGTTTLWPSTDDTYMTSYFGQHFLALAYAVDHSAPGAANAWLRIQGALNYASVTAQFNNRPQYGVVPRVEVGLPTWVPAPGTFANIGQNTLLQARPSTWPNSDVAGPFANWSGGAFDPDFGTMGGYVVHGSGHLTNGTPLWAGVWVYDIGARVWVGRNVPPAPLIEDSWLNGNFNSFAESTNPATAGHTYPPHTYDGLIIQRTADGGGPAGSLIRVAIGGGGISNASVVHRFDLSSATAPATRIINNLAGVNTSYPMTAADYGRGGFWALSYNGNGTLSFVRFSDWNITTYAGANFNDYGDFSMTYLPAPYDALVATGRTGSGGVSFGAYVLRLSNPSAGWTNITSRLTGTGPNGASAGTCWSEILNTLVYYEGNGSARVHRLTPPAPGSLTTGNWTWTSETLAAAGGATPSDNFTTNGTFGRFIEVPALRCFLWCDSVNQPVQAFRLTGM